MIAFSFCFAGCAVDQRERVEGVSFAAGDAIAANTVMQMVDPWPKNVQYTDIAVPAERAQYQRREDAAAEPTGSQAISSDGGAVGQSN